MAFLRRLTAQRKRLLFLAGAVAAAAVGCHDDSTPTENRCIDLTGTWTLTTHTAHGGQSEDGSGTTRVTQNGCAIQFAVCPSECAVVQGSIEAQQICIQWYSGPFDCTDDVL